LAESLQHINILIFEWDTACDSAYGLNENLAALHLIDTSFRNVKGAINGTMIEVNPLQQRKDGLTHKKIQHKCQSHSSMQHK